MELLAAVEINGHTTKAKIFDIKGVEIDSLKIKTNPDSMEDTMHYVVKFLQKHEVKKIAAAIPGPANYVTGYIFDTPNLPDWRNKSVFDFINQAMDVDILLSDNNASLKALANHFYFNGTEEDITQYFSVSSGLGSGLVINNKIFHGAKGYAQEISNTPLSWIKTQVMGYTEGSAELFVSESGIMKRSEKYDIQSLDEIFQAYENKERFAVELIDEGIETLANLIAVSAALINPSMIVFDGEITLKNPWFIERAIDLSSKRMFPQQFESIDFKFSEIIEEAALLGAFRLLTTKI